MRAAIYAFAGCLLTGAFTAARADCVQKGNEVTCGPPGDGGFQAKLKSHDLHVVVQSDAVVAVSNKHPAGIFVDKKSSVDNKGLILGGDGVVGIAGTNGNTLTNNGSILLGASVGIGGEANNHIYNKGFIGIDASSGPGVGIAVTKSGNSITNTGTIAVNGIGLGIAMGGGHNRFYNSGIVAVSGVGVGVGATGDDNIIVNKGTVVSEGVGGGISATGNGNEIDNSGNVIATSVGVSVTGSGNGLDNSGSITATGAGVVVIGNDNGVYNSGAIAATSVGVILAGDANYVYNSGTVTAAGAGVAATGNGNEIENAGSITATVTGVAVAGSDNIVFNTGTVTAKGVGVTLLGDFNELDNYGVVRSLGGASVFSCACGGGNLVNNYGTLDGTITLQGIDDSLNNYGLIKNSSWAGIGKTNLVAGIFSQSSTGTLELRVDNTGKSDSLVAGELKLAGTLRLAMKSGLYADKTNYLLLGSVLANAKTTFDRFEASSPFFTVKALYDTNDPTNYTLMGAELDRVKFGSVAGMTTNERVVGNLLERFYSSKLDPKSTLGQFYQNVLMSSSVNVLDQFSGSGTTAAQNAGFLAGNQFNASMMQQGLGWLNGTAGGNSVVVGAPLGYAAAKPGSDAFAAMPGKDASAPGRWRAWGLGFGATQSVDGDTSAGTSHTSTQTAGGSLGVDRLFANDLLLGFAAGGSRSNFSAGDVSTTGNADAGFFGFYGIKSLGPAYIAATLNYARAGNSTQRTITGGGPTEIANGSFTSDQFGGRFEVGWKHAFSGYSLTPFAAIEPTVLWQHAYSETSKTLGGAPGVKGLSYDENTVTSLPAFLGAQFDTRIALPYGQTLSPYVRASWVHEFKPDRSVTAAFNILPGATFSAEGTRAASDLARIETGATLALTSSAALFANASGEFSEHSRSYAGMFGARISW